MTLNETLYAHTVEDGWLLAYRLYEFGLINNLYRENDSTALTVAQYFEIVATANNYWRQTPLKKNYE